MKDNQSKAKVPSAEDEISKRIEISRQLIERLKGVS
jgi:hypothetical protein